MISSHMAGVCTAERDTGSVNEGFIGVAEAAFIGGTGNGKENKQQEHHEEWMNRGGVCLCDLCMSLENGLISWVSIVLFS